MSCSSSSTAASAAAESDPVAMPAAPVVAKPSAAFQAAQLAAAEANKAKTAVAELRAENAALVSKMDAMTEMLAALSAKLDAKPARKPRAPKAPTGGAGSVGGGGSVASTESKSSVRSADFRTWTYADCKSFFLAHESLDRETEDWVVDDFKATKNLQTYYRWLKNLPYHNPDERKINTPGATTKAAIIEQAESIHNQMWAIRKGATPASGVKVYREV